MKKLLLLPAFLCVFAQTHAQQTYVPDDNFEQALIDQGYDNVLDDYVTTAHISGITALNVYEKNILYLTGIQDFTALEELYCWSNQLTSLDLSQNTNLEILACWDNQLTSVDISQCILLEELEIGQNQLTNLDLSQNTALEKLLCDNNQLTSLNISQNTNLEILNCGTNQLIVLDVTQNILIEWLICGNNQLTSLDIRNGNNALINVFDAQYNPNLTCIFVEDKNYSANHSGWDKDPTAFYVETQVECDAIAGINDVFYHQIKIYPNPIKDLLHIDSDFRIQDSELILTSILGKKIYQAVISGQEIEIDLSHLKAGIYFLTIQNREKQSLTTKIIKL